MHPIHNSQISGASSVETLSLRDELSAQGPAGFLADPRILFEGVGIELQEVVESSAHNENLALLEETDAAVDEETVREQGFTKRSLPVILFAILFATLVFIGVSLRTRAYETASSRLRLLRIYDMLTPQFPPDSSINVTIDHVPTTITTEVPTTAAITTEVPTTAAITTEVPTTAAITSMYSDH